MQNITMHAHTNTHATFLRRVLALDAASCLVMGVAMIGGAGLAADLLGLPALLLQAASASLIPFAAAAVAVLAVLEWIGLRALERQRRSA